MKTFYVFMVVILYFTSCKKDDGSPDILQVGGPPLNFDLLEVPLNATEVDLTPTLSWESAKNPAAGEVTYDVYLGLEPNPTVLFEEGISETSFEVQDPLHITTDYYWKVIASDMDGKMAQSPIHKFTTRYYTFPNEPVNASANFSPRYGHSSVIFQDKIWVFGGREPGNEYKSDVWQSNNGIDWTEITPTADFKQGWGHSTTVFDNKLWVIEGGFGIFGSSTKSEIWHSSDGVNWLAANLDGPFSARNRHTTVAFDGKMWLIGGVGLGNSKNDVWYSSDGVNWTEATSTDSFSERAGHTSVVFDDRIWVIGGIGVGTSVGGGYLSDVWSSGDGINWVEATPAAPFLGKADHTTVVFDNKLWVIGGTSSDGVKNDVWYSSDGVNWTEATSTDSFSERRGHASVVFDNSIWIIGGGFDPFTTFYNDIWVME